MRSRSAAAGLLTAATVLTGCSPVDTSPIPGRLPEASAPAPARSLPASGAHWKGLRSACPELTGEAARRIGAAGAGTRTDEYATNPTVTNADCRWGSTDGQGTAVHARISIWARQEAADAQWQTLSVGRTNPVKVGDEGFTDDENGAVVVRTRSGNAVATVRLTAAAGASDQDQLSRAAAEITGDVLDDLVPG